MNEIISKLLKDTYVDNRIGIIKFIENQGKYKLVSLTNILCETNFLERLRKDGNFDEYFKRGEYLTTFLNDELKKFFLEELNIKYNDILDLKYIQFEKFNSIKLECDQVYIPKPLNLYTFILSNGIFLSSDEFNKNKYNIIMENSITTDIFNMEYYIYENIMVFVAFHPDSKRKTITFNICPIFSKFIRIFDIINSRGFML